MQIQINIKINHL